MGTPVWITTDANLGTAQHYVPFVKTVTASDTVSYSVAGGALPSGLLLNSVTGVLSGVPLVDNPISNVPIFIFTFTIRATSSTGDYADKIFKLPIVFYSLFIPANLSQTRIRFSSDKFQYQINRGTVDTSTNTYWRLEFGELPPNLILYQNGTLEGVSPNVAIPLSREQFIKRTVPVPMPNIAYFKVTDGVGNNDFVIKLTDPAKIQNARDQLNNVVPQLSITGLIIKSTVNYNPNYSYHYDPDTIDFFEYAMEVCDATFNYTEENLADAGGAFLPGLRLCPWSSLLVEEVFPTIAPPQLSQASWDSWLTGFLSTPHEFDYQFVLRLGTGTGPTQLSVTVRILYVKIPVTASWFVTNAAYVEYDPNRYYTFVSVSDSDYINWVTPADFGSVSNGSISELSVVAASNLNKQIFYTIKPYFTSTLPQQLILLDNGLISGRIAFKCYQDDPDNLPVNDDYYFTVRAINADRFTYVERTFKLHVERVNVVPYHNIWIRSFPTVTERQNLNKILDNEIIFPSRLLYRNPDPWFNKTKHLRFLFAPGLNDSTMEEYNTALENNHYNKTLLFGDVQTAVCYDERLRIRYEVVYLPVIDRLSTIEPGTHSLVGLPDVIDLRSQIKNYYFEDGQPYYIFKPNGLENMHHRLATSIGFYNQGIIPTWMTSVQPIPEKLGQFYSPPGFIHAVVLAYTVPGGSGVVAFRLKRAGVNFNNFKFEFDRYELDKKLSESFSEPPADLEEATLFDNDITTFENGTTKFNYGTDYILGLTGTGPYVGNKYLKFPKTGAFT